MGKMVHFLNQDDLGYYDCDYELGIVFFHFTHIKRFPNLNFKTY